MISDLGSIVERMSKLSQNRNALHSRIRNIQTFLKGMGPKRQNPKASPNFLKASENFMLYEEPAKEINRNNFKDGKDVVWITRIGSKKLKSIVPVDSSLFAQIKKSAVHSLNFNDRYEFSVLIVEGKAILSSGYGCLLNSFGRKLYRGWIMNGKLEGDGKLFNTLVVKGAPHYEHFAKGLNRIGVDIHSPEPEPDHICKFLQRINPGLSNLYFKNKVKKFSSDWVSYSGQFHENRIDGKGRIKYFNGAQLFGEFFKGDIDGVCKFADNKLEIIGLWQNNILQKVIDDEHDDEAGDDLNEPIEENPAICEFD